MNKPSKYAHARKSKGGVLAYHGECQVCGKFFEGANALGNAARHTDATGHITAVERVYITYYYVHDADDPYAQRKLKKADE